MKTYLRIFRFSILFIVLSTGLIFIQGLIAFNGVDSKLQFGMSAMAAFSAFLVSLPVSIIISVIVIKKELSADDISIYISKILMVGVVSAVLTNVIQVQILLIFINLISAFVFLLTPKKK